MTVYLDTSSLVKLYLDEPGSSEIAGLVSRATAVATSALAYPETRAALARRRRERGLTVRELTSARQQLDADWSTLLVVPFDAALALRAGALAESHALRGADAVHLAAFERLLAAVDDDETVFSCADERLSRAARRLGWSGFGLRVVRRAGL